MKIRKVILFLLAFLVIRGANAADKITGTPISKYEGTSKESVVEIKNITSEKEIISGSVMQIQDENGFVLYEFTMPKEAYVIEGLSEGKYYLVQLSVPDEYDINSNKVSFTVDSEKTEVEMLNDRSIILPGDMSSNSILLISVAMLNITIIIGVFVYVKKSKAKK